MARLAIIATHAIQYKAPWFRMLSEKQEVDVKVFYTWSQTKQAVKDRTFGMEIKWDIPLFEGYNYEFIENISKRPGSHHHYGIICPVLIEKITDWQPSAILIIGWNFKSHFKAMRHFYGTVPIYFRGDSTLLNMSGGLKDILRKIVLRYVYGFINKAFYVGTESKKYFKEYGIKEDNLIFTPHAVDNARFSENNLQWKSEALEWRKSLGFSTKDIVILYAGKFEEVKNLFVLIEAFEKCNEIRLEKLKLVMVGTGPLSKDIETRVEDNEHVKLLPFQNQSRMPVVYRLGDIFCLPSKSETWGLAINESFACSIPAIVSDKVGCAADLIIQGKSGYIFKNTNVADLTQILTNLDKQNCNEMGLFANNLIRDWSFKNIVNQISKEIVSID